MTIRNPVALARHDKFRDQFIEYATTEHSIDCALPPASVVEENGWDLGWDATIGNTIVDFKSFGLRRYGRSMVWDSDFKKYMGAYPLYEKSITEYFIHVVGNNPDDWLVAPASALQRSKIGFQPWYRPQAVMTMREFLAVCQSK